MKAVSTARIIVFSSIVVLSVISIFSAFLFLYPSKKEVPSFSLDEKNTEVRLPNLNFGEDCFIHLSSPDKKITFLSSEKCNRLKDFTITRDELLDFGGFGEYRIIVLTNTTEEGRTFLVDVR